MERSCTNRLKWLTVPTDRLLRATAEGWDHNTPIWCHSEPQLSRLKPLRIIITYRISGSGWCRAKALPLARRWIIDSRDQVLRAVWLFSRLQQQMLSNYRVLRWPCELRSIGLNRTDKTSKYWCRTREWVIWIKQLICTIVKLWIPNAAARIAREASLSFWGPNKRRVIKLMPSTWTLGTIRWWKNSSKR